MKRNTIFFCLGVLAFVALVSCGTSRKMRTMTEGKMAAQIQLPESRTFVPEVQDIPAVKKDTLKITDLDGKEVLIMKAIKDDETGEMVATEQLDAAVVTARFRNLAERHGKVDLEFQVIVPEAMRDSKWQLRMHPDMFILQDSIRLDDVVITGDQYRKAQLRGYQQYQRFLDSIRDSAAFVDTRNLTIWLERNLPQIYAFANDSTEVSDEEFYSYYGVSEQEAVEHYTNKLARSLNNRKIANRQKMWNRFVKTPIVTDGIRLDTVMVGANGDFIYNYIQTINTRKGLRKVDVVLSGEIYEQDRRLYTIPTSEPLTFYISSVAAFVDNTERYLTKTISRRVNAAATANIEFREGKADIEENLSENAREIANIKENLRSLLASDEFVLDSITIAPFASPEGAERSNDLLCLRRAESAARYFSRYVEYVRDSIRREEGFFITIGEDNSESGMKASDRGSARIDFKSKAGGENWLLLDELVDRDTLLTDGQKADYRLAREEVEDADAREKRIAAQPYYKHLRNDLYPRLRSVRFDFALHRRGMVQETMETTEPDTVYARGVQCIRDRDFETAIEILRPYQDYNTAVAYVAMDYNQSAMAILEDCERTAMVNYMLALLYSRAGDDQNAVQCYMNACQQDASYISRGNLDPEITVLIKKYNLNAEPEDDWGDLGF